jgi:hypothetical protein
VDQVAGEPAEPALGGHLQLKASRHSLYTCSNLVHKPNQAQILTILEQMVLRVDGESC